MLGTGHRIKTLLEAVVFWIGICCDNLLITGYYQFTRLTYKNILARYFQKL